MSLQAGVWNFCGNDEPPSFDSWRANFKPYYADSESIYSIPPVAILYGAFHVTSESRLEQQPFVSADGKVITWDGRLDNRAELLAMFENNQEITTTDVEIIGTAFSRWGCNCFDKLIGDWALAIWDPAVQELILARDYIGSRALYYSIDSKRVLWCTRLAALTRLSARLTICAEYVAGYLAYHPDAHLTPYREIASVPPAHFIRIRDGKLHQVHYWRLDAEEQIRYRSDFEYEDHFRHLLQQSVKRRLRTDTPVLAELSGGLDSSTIVCVADDLIRRGACDAKTLETLSYFNPTEPGEDDRAHFSLIEKSRGRTGHHLDLSAAPVLFNFWGSDFQPAPGLGPAPEIESARNSVVEAGNHRTILSGTGGDELLGQALDPRLEAADLLWGLKIRSGLSHLYKWSLITQRPIVHLFLQTVLMMLPAPFRAMTSQKTVEPWLLPKFSRRFDMAKRSLQASEGPFYWRPSRRDAVQTVATLARQMTCARPSIAEKRYPYLDRDLVGFLTHIPLSQLLRPNEQRSLMRRALKHLVPSPILQRRTKASAGRCYSLLLHTCWPRIEEGLRPGLSRELGIIDIQKLSNELLMIKKGILSPNFLTAFRALALELWLQDISARGMVLRSA